VGRTVGLWKKQVSSLAFRARRRNVPLRLLAAG